MRFARAARIGLLLAGLPFVSVGCASMSPKMGVLASVARHRADSQYMAARDAEQRGQYEKARELYASLQRHSPNVPQYAHRMGVVCTQLQDYATAGKYFDHARQLDPQNSTLLADMGYSAYLQKNYRLAEELLKESVEAGPLEPRAVNNLAMAIGFQGRYDESLELFRRVNSETQSQLNVAFIQTQRSDIDQAVAVYQKVLSAEPANKVAANALQQLNSSRARPATDSPRTPDAVATLPNLRSAWEVEPPAHAATPTSPLEETPLSLSGSDLPLPIIGPQSPLISGNTTPWVPTQPAESPENLTPESATEVASSDTDFELPRRSEIPAELSAMPDEQSKPVDSSARENGAGPVAAVPLAEPQSKETQHEDAKTFREDDNLPERPGADTDELAGLDWVKEKLAQQKTSTEVVAKPADNCLRGFCPVALRDERRLAQTHTEFTTEYQAQVYHFHSAAARDKFLDHPEWYIPAAGGLDVIEVKHGNSVTLGSLEHACWFRHRLHMFASAENLAAFRAAPREYFVNQ